MSVQKGRCDSIPRSGVGTKASGADGGPLHCWATRFPCVQSPDRLRCPTTTCGTVPLSASRAKDEDALAAVPDVEPDERDRLEDACGRLDAAEERMLAEEGIAADFDAWPEYADELRAELDRRLDDQAARPGVGLPWSEVKRRLLGS